MWQETYRRNRNHQVGVVVALLISAVATSVLAPVFAQSPAAPRAADGAPNALALEELKAGARIEKVGIIDAVAMGKRIIAVGERGMLFVSDDNGKTWASRLVPTEKVLTSITVVDDKVALVTGQGGVLAYSADAGERWQLSEVSGKQKEALFGILMLDGKRGIAYGAYASFLVTEDGGKRWEQRAVFPAEIDKHIYGIVRSGDVLVLVGEAGLMARSSDLGKTWQVVESPYSGSLFGITALGNGTLVAYGMRGKVYQSSDQGRTWRGVVSGANSPFYSATQLAAGTLLLTGKDGMLSRLGKGEIALETRYTVDHRSVARALVSGGADWLLFGGGGVRRVEWNKLGK